MYFRRLASCLLVLVVLLSASSARAHEAGDLTAIPFDELVQREVVSASRMARQISDSPSAVAIVTAADIRAYGYRTLADVINGIRGLHTTWDHRYQYMGGRGFSGESDHAGRVMLLIDGFPVQENLFNQAYIDESGLLDLEVVDRVEYVPGTGSVTYGNNALLGILNVVTRKGRDFDGAQLSGELSSHGGRKQRVTYGRQFDNGAEVLLSASALQVEGRDLYFPAYDTPDTNRGWARGLDGERAQRFFGKASFQGWSIEGVYAERSKDVPTNPGGLIAFNAPFRMQDENAFLSARYETEVGLRLRSSSSLFFGSYRYWNRRQFSDWSTDDEKFGERDYQGNWWSFDQKIVGDWFADHTLVFGFELRNDYRQRFNRRYLSPVGEVVRRASEAFTRKTASFYAADDYRLDERWALNVGIRYDDADDLDGNLSPRIALIHQADPWTTLKASYSEAFKMPNAADRSSFAGYGDAAEPERVAATELVVQRQMTPQTRLIGSLYRYRRSKQMVFSEAADDYVASGASTTRGVELELEHGNERGMRLRGSVAWQRALDVEDKDLANSPNLLGKLALSLPIVSDAVRTGLEVQYVGGRDTLERRHLGGVTLANLTFSSERKWHGLSASVSVRNLFDRRYETVSFFAWRPDSGVRQDAFRMDGRTWWFQLNYDL